MVKAVLTTKVEPAYDDLPEARYHFPATYLRQAEAAIGDWIVYYEPRRRSADLSSRGGRMVYFATARLRSIEPDPMRAGHFYARVSDYLDFPNPVPFSDRGSSFESALRKADGSTNRGSFGRSVRSIPDAEYNAIVAAGHAATFSPRFDDPDLSAALRTADPPGFSEAAPGFDHGPPPEIVPREMVAQLGQRRFRDRAFAAAVKTAYDDTCAITRLRIINGGGRSEVQAAHIRAVEKDGPDSVRNGLALSGTVHWLFDRGLISVDDDHSLLIARDRLPEPVLNLLTHPRLHLPARADLRPHPAFLRHHRETVFKG